MAIKVAQQVLDPSGTGGVSSEFRALKKSSLGEKYSFCPVVLMSCHRGINYQDINFYRAEFKKINPDIVHIRGLGPDGLNAIIGARLAGCKRILVAVHGMYSDLVYISPVKRVISRVCIEDISLLLSSGISCVCRYAMERKRFNFFRKKMMPYVYNRAPDYSNYDSGRLRIEARRELGITSQDRVGVYVGRITREKGVLFLADALSSLDASWPSNFKFLFVGDGSELKLLKKQTNEMINSDSIIYLGEQDKVYRYLFASDFFCMPSLHENHSISLLEAAAASLPIIATDVGGNSEIVDSGINGVLVSPAASGELENAIRNIVSNDELFLSYKKGAALNDLRRFSSEAIDAQLDSVYSSLLLND